jgi:hypothetical protein
MISATGLSVRRHVTAHRHGVKRGYADLHRAEQRHQSPGTLIFEGPLRAAALAASAAAAMILRLRLNEMDLQRSKQMLGFLQRQPDHLRHIFGHGRATADLMNANGPVRSDQLQHDPPLHPELPATTTGRAVP